ncbi:MAG: DUF4266 domain-containing protein [Novosphingobium sp.]
MKRILLCGGLILSVSGLSACASVAPWQRDITARQSMALVKNGNFAAARDHIYFSKEAATGGASLDGGGCGCN